MASDNEILKALHDLWRAKLHLKLFVLSENVTNPKVKVQFKGYINKIEYIVNDIKLHPQCSEEIRQAINEEWNSDILTIDSIQEKVLKLTPQERDSIETILDCILSGETINIVYNDTDNQS